MLTGKAIFADEDVYAGYKKRRSAEQLVRETLGPIGTPEPVIAVLSRALAFDPKQRPTKVEELSGPLTKVHEPPAVVASPSRPVSAVIPTVRITRQTPSEPIITVEREEVGDLLETKNAKRPPSAPMPAVPGSAAASAEPPRPSEPTPQPEWKPPTLVPPWMTTASAPIASAGANAHRLLLSDTAIHALQRRIHFVFVPGGVADLIGTQNSRVRVSLLPGPSGRIVHIKGMTCFVSILGGRPSPAVHLERGADVALVTPRAQEIGHIRVATSSTQTGQSVFPIGSEFVAVGLEDCTDPILFDFGPGSDAYLVYTRGRALPPKRR
jgi:hypothetical protein